MLGLVLSLQPFEASQVLTNGLADYVAGLLNIDTSEGAGRFIFNSYSFRKVLHFSMYGIASVPLFLLFHTYFLKLRYSYLLTLMTVIFYAVIDEGVQLYFTDRHFHVTDMMIDLSGSFVVVSLFSVGILAVRAIQRKSRRD